MRRYLFWLRRHWRELALALFILSPWMSLLVLGMVWLRDNHALLPWLAGAAALGLAAWPLRRAVRNRLREEAQEQIRMLRQPSPEWNANAQAAWRKVEGYASSVSPLTFTEVEPARNLAVETVRVVAEHFNPNAAKPEADITLPEVLMLLEQAAHDLRTALVKTVPGVRSIKIGDALVVGSVAGRYADLAHAAYTRLSPLYSLFLLLYANPPAGVARIANSQGVGATLDVGLDWLRTYGTRMFVIEVGRAAIDLYSGKLQLSDKEIADALEAERAARSRIADQPPQLVIAGQVNAGKSSLVNALAGEVLCEISSTPVPAVGVKHELKVDGKVAAIIVEAPGLTTAADAQAATIKAVQGSDIVVWVASATQPGRAADSTALAALADIHTADLKGRPPPILVALTHVDQLAPASEWAPPYDVAKGTRPKELVMRRALESVSKTLGVDIEAIVPVAVPPGADAWNTERLWGCIAARLEEAKYRQLARVKLARAGSSWREVAGQAINLGRMGAKAAADIAVKSLKRGDGH